VNKRYESESSRARNLTAQRGDGRAKAVLWTLLFLSLLYVSYKIIPPYVKDYELQEKMQETARFASAFHKPEEELRDTIYKEIQDLDIPAKREDIKVEYSGRTVRISVEYIVPMDFLIYRRDMHFNPTSENRSII
jgi:hypothetical protein